MKKLFLGLGLVAGTLAFAQTTTPTSTAGPKFGIKAGVNVSSLSGDGYDDTKSKVGFSGGLFMNAPLSEQFSIQPEVMYSQMGSKIEGKFANTTYSTTRSLDYITVPVMFQFRATPEFYIEAGPEFGFLVSAKDSDTVGNFSTTNQIDTDNFNTFNLGLGLGLGFDITENFGVNARYVAGFTDINKDGNTSLQNDGNKNRNNTFQGGVYFKF
ncbi:MAG: PorT family protein [Weeksellaceae bacterium]|nr:PorT family protein [Weeksellaceae bacterium]